jgi:rhodanese-related sulfurtransferase
MNKCGVKDLEEALNKPGCQLVDVREDAEFESEHIQGALSLPLSALDVDAAKIIQKDKPLFLVCRSGMRASKAAEQLEKFGFSDVKVLEGGLQAWTQEGKEVTRGTHRVWDIDRQVRFAAGSLVLTGVILSMFLHPYWIALSAFVGAGLVFSGVTNTCGMALCLARMPWNKKKA